MCVCVCLFAGLRYKWPGRLSLNASEVEGCRTGEGRTQCIFRADQHSDCQRIKTLTCSRLPSEQETHHQWIQWVITLHVYVPVWWLCQGGQEGGSDSETKVSDNCNQSLSKIKTSTFLALWSLWVFLTNAHEEIEPRVEKHRNYPLRLEKCDLVL